MANYAHDTQVGGSHYAQAEGLPQHWDLVAMYGWDYFEGQVIKYVMRWRKKNGLEDLKKARSYLDKYIQIMETGQVGVEATPESRVEYESFEISARDPVLWYDFEDEIHKFNTMYGLPLSDEPTVKPGEPFDLRLTKFLHNIREEVLEGDDLLVGYLKMQPLDALTEMADWLGDIIVWAASEMLKYGIPIMDTLQLIMKSQWSKLGEDGNPIVVDGRVIKGPNYQKPEPMIREMLASRMHKVHHEPSNVDLGKPVYVPHPTLKEDIPDDWQYEGFYGDGTQLYRNKETRLMFRCHSIAQALQEHAAHLGAMPTARQPLGPFTGP